MIRPPSDIVADVARAADPTRLAEARARLGATAGAAVAASDRPSPFDVALRQAETFTTSTRQGGVGRSAAIDPAWRGLEEVLLGRLLETMMPAGSSALYGGGSAGRIWRGFMAEHLARSAASGQGVGVAAALSAGAAARRATDRGAS